MDGEDIKALIRKQPSEPIEIGLSASRSALVRHPDQVAISRRHVIFGLAQVRRASKHFSTPINGDAIARDWLLMDLIHVVSAEPADDKTAKRKRGEPRPPRR